jgi:YidC/Oxa1 family membrane protein insertase
VILLDYPVWEQIKEILRWVLEFYHGHGMSWGWAIVMLTVTVRLLMVPLTVKQFRSMAAMQTLQPKVRALQNKYKGKTSRDDKQAMQKEMMELYREHNINPFASCLPMVAQIPVFLGLYRVLYDFAHQTPPIHSSFLGIQDIFASLHSAGTTTEAIVVVVYVLTTMGSTLLFSFVADPQQRYMLAGVSIIFVFFVIRVPIGVAVYWITTNLWTITQQGIIKRTMGHMLPAPQPKPPRGGGSGGRRPPPRRKPNSSSGDGRSKRRR